MGRRVIYITKAPEFDSAGEVRLGQCEFHTDNWMLCATGDGAAEQLAFGRFRLMDQIMAQLHDVDDIEAIREKVKAFSGAAAATEEPAFANDDTRLLDALSGAEQTYDVGRLIRAMDEFFVNGGQGDIDKSVPFSISAYDDYAIGAILNPIIVSETGLLNKALLALSLKPAQTLILDLNVVKVISSRSIHELIRFHKKMRDDDRRFFLAGLRRSVQRILNLMNLDSIITYFPTVDEAVAVAREL